MHTVLTRSFLVLGLAAFSVALGGCSGDDEGEATKSSEAAVQKVEPERHAAKVAMCRKLEGWAEGMDLVEKTVTLEGEPRRDDQLLTSSFFTPMRKDYVPGDPHGALTTLFDLVTFSLDGKNGCLEGTEKLVLRARDPNDLSKVDALFTDAHAIVVEGKAKLSPSPRSTDGQLVQVLQSCDSWSSAEQGKLGFCTHTHPVFSFGRCEKPHSAICSAIANKKLEISLGTSDAPGLALVETQYIDPEASDFALLTFPNPVRLAGHLHEATVK